MLQCPLMNCRLNRSTQHFIVEGKDRECRTIGQGLRSGMGAAAKMVLWDSWLRGESPKAIGRAFGKPSSLFIASWPPVLRRPVETTSNSGQTRVRSDCPLSADIVAKVFLHRESKILRTAGAAFV